MRPLAVLFVLASSCGGLGDSGGGAPSPGGNAPTSADAALTASAVANTTLQVLSLGAAKPGGAMRVSLVTPATSQVTATPTKSCGERVLPRVSPSTPYQVLVHGSQLGGSGTAFFAMEPGEATMKATASFDLFDVPQLTEGLALDGTVDYAGTIFALSDTGISVTLDASSRGFQVYLDDGGVHVCDVVVDLHNVASAALGAGSMSYQRSLTGCLSLCGLAFALSGSESGTLSPR